MSQIFDLQNAGEAALAGSSTDGLQRSLNCISHPYERAGLSIYTDKIEVMAQLQNLQPYDELTVYGRKPKNVQHIMYLGAMITNNCGMDTEVQRWIGLAAASFGKFNPYVLQ